MSSDAPFAVHPKGTLALGPKSWSISLSRHTRHTAKVEASEPPLPAAGTVFERVTIDAAGATHELGRCRLEPGGALCPLDDAYDFGQLFELGKLSRSDQGLQELSLLLAQRDEVPEKFKQYTADLRYGLSLYERFFDEHDRLLEGEPPAVAEAAREAIVRRHRAAFERYFDQELDRLAALVEPMPREVYERCGTYLRRLNWSFIARSAFLLRTNLKPRGYPGDAEMMRMVYSDADVGARSFDRLLHRHPISTPAARAVRSRRKLVAQQLRQLEGRLAPGRLRFISVACGPAAELFELFATPAAAERWSGTLLDQDPEALAAAKATAQAVTQATGVSPDLSYLSDSVRTMLRERQLAERLGRFHFIYSMGMFDYLTPPVARAVLARLYGLLEPGGVLLVGNYHAHHPTRHYMAMWMDWVLYLRTEAEFAALAGGLDGAKVSITFDETRSQMFLLVEHP